MMQTTKRRGAPRAKQPRPCSQCGTTYQPTINRQRVCVPCREGCGTPTVPKSIRDRHGDEPRQARISHALKQARKAVADSEYAHARDLIAYAQNAAQGREATGEAQLRAWGFRFAGSPEATGSVNRGE